MIKKYVRVPIQAVLIACLAPVSVFSNSPLEDRIEALEAGTQVEWIRSGSNPNGTWVQFEDGTMICYSTDLGPVNVTSSKGDGFESGDLTWVFPAVFIEAPTVTAGAGNLNVWAVPRGYSSYVDSVFIRAHAFTERTGITLTATAVGKWKSGGNTAPAPTENAGQSIQTHTDLNEFGPRAGRVVLSSSSWNGTSDQDISRIGPGVIPVGGFFTLVLPRTIGATGGPAGYGSGVIGSSVKIRHLGGNIECVANNRLSYYAYPNACDALGNDAALEEHLVFQRTASGWALITLPSPRTGMTDVNPPFTWERRADGTAEISNGAVTLSALIRPNDTGNSGSRFYRAIEFPFRFEQHVGNHRSFQFGIVGKSGSVPFSVLSVPRNSSTTTDGMNLQVYVKTGEQSKVVSGNNVTVSISGHGNWKLRGTPGE